MEKIFRTEKYSDVKILYIGKKVSISKFKKGQRKITKIEYEKYDYDWAINFGLFYIAFSKHKFIKGWNIDISSKLGLIRYLKK